MRQVARVAAATLVLWYVEVGLMTLGLSRLCRLSRIALAAPTSDPPRDAFPAATEPWVRAARRVVGPRGGRGRCLRESLVVGVLLRHHDPVLRIGVARPSSQLAAHAWVEIDGAAYDPDARQFAVLERSEG
jgi:hypothetical protein